MKKNTKKSEQVNLFTLFCVLQEPKIQNYVLVQIGNKSFSESRKYLHVN